MRPTGDKRELTHSGSGESISFGISEDNRGHILNILRNTLYTNKVLAVLREYISNAWDAHRSVGKGEVPIRVVLPTALNPNVTIQDFGPGLSPEQVRTVYTQYGMSTKRDSNLAVGMLGIGSKAGFAYSDSFTIVSRNGGTRTTYQAVLDSSDVGEIRRVFEGLPLTELEEYLGRGLDGESEWVGLEDSGVDREEFSKWMCSAHPEWETGLSVQVPVDPEDIDQFHSEARTLFRNIEPTPDGNLDFHALDVKIFKFPSGSIRVPHIRHPISMYALMGCVAYPVDTDLVRPLLGWSVRRHLTSSHQITLPFNIGDLPIAANREGLEYLRGVPEKIADKVLSLFREAQSALEDVLSDDTKTDWQKRLLIRGMWHPAPPKGDILEYSLHEVEMHSPVFNTKRVHGVVFRTSPKVSVSERARLVVHDSRHGISRYGLKSSDLVITSKKGQSIPDLDAALEEKVKGCRCGGIPVVRTSSMTPTPLKRVQRVAHHDEFTLRLDLLGREGRCTNAHWEGVRRPSPTPSDVFVRIHRGAPVGWCGARPFIETLRDDKSCLDAVGHPFPTIWGIKVSLNSPLLDEDIVGTPYSKWVMKSLQKVWDDPEMVSVLRRHKSAGMASYDTLGLTLGRREWIKTALELEGSIGKDHPLALALRTEVSELCPSFETPYSELQRLRRVVTHLTSSLGAEAPANRVSVVLERYPLLQGSLRLLCRSPRAVRASWIDYVLALDLLIQTR